MKKTVLALLVVFCIALPFSASGAKDSSSSTMENSQQSKPQLQDTSSEVVISALNGPSGIGMAYLFSHHPDLGDVKATFISTARPDVLLPKMLKGEVDIGLLPANVAAKVYNTTGKIVMGSIVGEGNLYVLSRDKNVSSFSDLIGKNVFVAGHGATPDYMMRYLASKELIEIGEGAQKIAMDFSIPTPEIAPSLIAGKIEYALVPEPFATICLLKDQSIRRSINLQSLWVSYAKEATNYPLTVCVIREDYAKENPDVVRAFLDSYKYSIEWTNKNPVEAGKLVEKHTLGLNAAITAKSIPTASFVFVGNPEAKQHVERLLEIFMMESPESIGEKLPDDGFYFK